MSATKEKPVNVEQTSAGSFIVYFVNQSGPDLKLARKQITNGKYDQLPPEEIQTGRQGSWAFTVTPRDANCKGEVAYKTPRDGVVEIFWETAQNPVFIQRTPLQYRIVLEDPNGPRTRAQLEKI